jgi:hypothetical protein
LSRTVIEGTKYLSSFAVRDSIDHPRTELNRGLRVLMVFIPRRHLLTKVFFAIAVILGARLVFVPPSSSAPLDPSAFQSYNVFERVTGVDKILNVRKYKFLQARMGRDSMKDIFDDTIANGVADYWNRFQMPL